VILPLLRVAFALALLVVGASSWLRLTGNGLGCQPWPQCYGLPQTAAQAQQGRAATVVRLVHRVAASAFALVAVALVAALWRPAGRQRTAGVALLLLTAVLAVLGRYTPSPWPAVTLVNALGGLGLLALLGWLAGARQSAGDRGVPRAASIALGLLLAALLLQAATGTMISVRLAAAACAQGCSAVWVPGAATLWNPALAGSATELTGHPLGGMPLHALHRAGGLLLLIAAVVVAGSALLRGSAARPGPALWAAGATVATGIALIGLDAGAAAGAAHMLFAGLALAAFAAALGRSAPGRRDP
jgi:heme a synthase